MDCSLESLGSFYVWVFLSAFFRHAACLTMSWVGLWSVIVAFPGPEVIFFFMIRSRGYKLFSCSTQPSMKFQPLIKSKMLKIKIFTFMYIY